MKRFLFWFAVFFGLFLTFHTIRIAVREKDMSKTLVKKFKKDVLYITAPDLFAERNIIEIFNKRYGVSIKFSFQNDLSKFLSLKSEADAIIYPTFAYNSIYSANLLKPISIEKLSNYKTLMEMAKKEVKEQYTKDKIYAIPIAYVPYALFFSKTQLKESLSGKEIIDLTPSIAMADNLGSFLFLCKVFNLPLKESSLSFIKKKLEGKKVNYFNADNPAEMVKELNETKPKLIVAPSYCKNILEREFGDFEMILPKEGTYAEYYLVSLLKVEDDDLSHVLINHLIEPLIQRNLTEVMGLGITNYSAMANITPVLYNSLKMNDEKYLSDMFILRKEADFFAAKELFEKMKVMF